MKYIFCQFTFMQSRSKIDTLCDVSGTNFSIYDENELIAKMI